MHLEPFTKQQSELRSCRMPFPSRHLPVFRNLSQLQPDQLQSGLVTHMSITAKRMHFALFFPRKR